MWVDENSKVWFQEHLDRSGAVVLDVPASGDHFSLPAGVTHVPLRILQPGPGVYAVAVPADILPQSGTRDTPFDTPQVRNGWRLLALPPMFSLDDALRAAGQVLHLEVPAPAATPVPQPHALPPAPMQEAPVRVPAAAQNTSSHLPAAVARYCRDLSADAAEGRMNTFIGRDDVIDQLVKILLQKDKNCPCLIGEPGVGKTAVVDGLALRGVRGELPERLRDLRVLALDVTALLAGASHRGETEQRFQSLLEALARQPQWVLFIDELHLITEVRGDVSLVDVLKPPMARGLRLIGATTQAEYRTRILRDAALTRRLDAVRVPPPTAEETRAILQARLPALEAHHGVRVDPALVAEIVHVTQLYLPDLYEPDRSLTLLDRAMAAQAFEGGSQSHV